MNCVLWAVQIFLAALFLFAGIAKLVMPIAQITSITHLPVWFLYFVSFSEIAGAIGLILPQALKIQMWLTPLAAGLLIIIMIGAVVVTLQALPVKQAILPFVTGLLCAFVAWGRGRE